MVYPDAVSERASRAPARRPGDPADAVGVAANLSCGTFVRISLSVDDGSAVTKVGISSNGCGYMLAAADILSEFVSGRLLSGLHGLSDHELTATISDVLGNIPGERLGCMGAAIEALRAVFADLRARRVEEFRGETALICSCFGVSQDRIEAEIKDKSLDTVDDVTSACNAGGGCGSCRMLIQELIDMHQNLT